MRRTVASGSPKMPANSVVSMNGIEARYLRVCMSRCVGLTLDSVTPLLNEPLLCISFLVRTKHFVIYPLMHSIPRGHQTCGRQ